MTNDERRTSFVLRPSSFVKGMGQMLWKRRRGRVIVQVDGAIGTTQQASGLGVVVRDQGGRVLEVWSKRARPQTCNEAEYEALIWALELLERDPPAEVHFFSDSEIVVRSTAHCGEADARALFRTQPGPEASAPAGVRPGPCHSQGHLHPHPPG